MATLNEPHGDADDRSVDRLLDSRLQQVSWPSQRRAQFVEQLHAQLQVTQGSSPPAVLRLSIRNLVVRRWRRVEIAIATSVVVATLALTYWYYANPWMSIGAQELANWAQQDWRPEERGWQSLRTAGPLDERPMSDYLRATPRRWQSLATHLDPRSAVYDLATPSGGQQLYVFRAQRPVVGLPETPPQQPQTERSGKYFAAWQEGEFVYILSVPGPLRNYWNAVESSGTPLAESSDLHQHGSREIRN